MTGPTVLVFVLAITVLLVAAFLIGTAEFDETLDRWRAERDLRDGVAEWEQVKRDLAPKSPRSIP